MKTAKLVVPKTRKGVFALEKASVSLEAPRVVAVCAKRGSWAVIVLCSVSAMPWDAFVVVQTEVNARKTATEDPRSANARKGSWEKSVALIVPDRRMEKFALVMEHVSWMRKQKRANAFARRDLSVTVAKSHARRTRTEMCAMDMANARRKARLRNVSAQEVSLVPIATVTALVVRKQMARSPAVGMEPVP